MSGKTPLAIRKWEHTFGLPKVGMHLWSFTYKCINVAMYKYTDMGAYIYIDKVVNTHIYATNESVYLYPYMHICIWI